MAGGKAAPAAGPGPGADGGEGEDGEAGLGWVEALRGDCEPEHHWNYRREFLIRNAEASSLPVSSDSAAMRRLVSFSMVWANHVFLGCRYPQQVMEKVKDMAVGITVTNAPTHTLRDELVAKVKRGISSSNEEPCKKRVLASNRASEDNRSDAKSTKEEEPMETDTEPMKNTEKEAVKDPEKSPPSTVAQKGAPAASPPEAQKGAPAASPPGAQKGAPAASPPGAQKGAPAASPPGAQKGAPEASPPGAQKGAPTASPGGVKIEPRLSNYEPTTATRHKSVLAPALSGPESKINYCLTKPSESKSENVLPSEKKDSLEGAAVLASKSSSHVSAVPAKVPLKLLTSEDAKERQPFFNRLYKAVAWKLVAVGGFSPTVNHVELLNSSIQSVKATLDVDFVPLKELTDLPQNKSSQENVVCELRCKSVYLGTGCGKSKENAKAVASREALKLFLKKKVIVKLCKRKYKGREIEDLVLLDEESKLVNLPPALRNPQEIL